MSFNPRGNGRKHRPSAKTPHRLYIDVPKKRYPPNITSLTFSPYSRFGGFSMMASRQLTKNTSIEDDEEENTPIL